jgi:DNA-binding transcriptional MerR regulator
MRKNRWKLRRYVKITAVVILLSFLKFPVYAEPLTEQQQNSSESGTRLYSDSEVECLAELDRLIDEISGAALEAIERASAEAARAAALAALEREALLLQAKALALREAQRWQLEAEAARRNGRKNAVIAGLVCCLGGLAVGVGGTLIIGGR